jgi:hypothetical protein
MLSRMDIRKIGKSILTVLGGSTCASSDGQYLREWQKDSSDECAWEGLQKNRSDKEWLIKVGRSFAEAISF